MPNGKDEAAIAAIDAEAIKPALDLPGITLHVRQSRLWNAGPAALAALEQRQAAERQAQLRHAPRQPAPDRAWATPENVIRLRLDD